MLEANLAGMSLDETREVGDYLLGALAASVSTRVFTESLDLALDHLDRARLQRAIRASARGEFPVVFVEEPHSLDSPGCGGWEACSVHGAQSS